MVSTFKNINEDMNLNNKDSFEVNNYIKEIYQGNTNI